MIYVILLSSRHVGFERDVQWTPLALFDLEVEKSIPPA